MIKYGKVLLKVQNYAQEQSITINVLHTWLLWVEMKMLFKVALKIFLAMKCYEVMLCFAMRVPGLKEELVVCISLL